MVIGPDVRIPLVFMWEETGVPLRNPPARLSDHMTISHATLGIKPGHSDERWVL